MSTTNTELRVPASGFSIKPAAQVGGFVIAFLIASLLCALPLALLMGTRTVGIWYILPFTFLFLYLYQRFIHKEALSSLGLSLKDHCLRNVSIGFAVTGVGFAGIIGIQDATGLLAIKSTDVAGANPLYVGAGIALGVLLTLGIGVGEELIFRGYILRRLLVGYKSVVPGVVISSGLFSLAHLPREPDALALTDLLLLGVVLALAVILTKSLWLSIGIHAGWDFWEDGIYYYRLPRLEVSRILNFQYHINGFIQLVAFKLIVVAFLVAAATWIALRIRGQYRANKPQEV